jgi:hypothetical protein
MSPLAVWRASIVLLALVAVPASNARASDAEVIATCLKTEGDAWRDFHACVGRVSGPCIEVPATQSDSGMAECTRRETKI